MERSFHKEYSKISNFYDTNHLKVAIAAKVKIFRKYICMPNTMHG
jgi:hypothetical protein